VTLIRRSDMATSPSQKWENGVMVERAIETNRWRVLPDGTEVGEDEEVEATATKPYKAPVPTKMVAAAEVEDKAVKASARTTKKK
jgi:hypothetical protein